MQLLENQVFTTFILYDDFKNYDIVKGKKELAAQLFNMVKNNAKKFTWVNRRAKLKKRGKQAIVANLVRRNIYALVEFGSDINTPPFMLPYPYKKDENNMVVYATESIPKTLPLTVQFDDGTVKEAVLEYNDGVSTVGDYTVHSMWEIVSVL
jgi:hypothetical protein